jgi:hypothetical protein
LHRSQQGIGAPAQHHVERSEMDMLLKENSSSYECAEREQFEE